MEKEEVYSVTFSPSAPLLRIYLNRWGFSDVMPLEDAELGDLYSGFLVKYKDQDAVEVVDTEARAITDENVRNLVVAHSRFIVHTASGLVAYHPIGNLISASVFQSQFCRLMENAVNEVFFSAELLPINQLEMFQ